MIQSVSTKDKPDKLLSTVSFFWTNEALAEFQAAWDAQDYDIDHVPEWIEWLWKIGTADNGFPSTSGFHWKSEAALNDDIFIHLFNAARSGCNLTLARTYYKLWSKWSDRNNDAACDYLASAWDCISTAQVLLAARFGAFIDWYVEDLADL